MIILQIMPDEEFAIALRTKKQTQSEVMDQTPHESMRKVEE
jgi:hypothetical protein